jgi:hypothetical protein
MSSTLTIDGLDERAASSLARRMAGHHEVRADDRRGCSCSLSIETQASSLAQVLHVVEEWAASSGRRGVRVSLDGAHYILEPRREIRPGVRLPRDFRH